MPPEGARQRGESLAGTAEPVARVAENTTLVVPRDSSREVLAANGARDSLVEAVSSTNPVESREKSGGNIGM